MGIRGNGSPHLETEPPETHPNPEPRGKDPTEVEPSARTTMEQSTAQKVDPPKQMELSSKKRKHPMGSRTTRRKNMARKRQWQLGMEMVVSEVPLTLPQKSVLSKGRSFVPGPPSLKPIENNVTASLKELETEINHRFTQSLLPGSLPPDKNKKSTKMPMQLPFQKGKRLPPKRLPGLAEKIDEAQKEILTAGKRKNRLNLNRKEIEALEQLKENPNIVIKKADKDGALVVLKAGNYRAMGRAHLKDKETYTPLVDEEEALRKVDNESKRLVNRFYTLDSPGRKCTSFKAAQRDALLAHKPSIPHWYILPKTHKKIDEELGTWPGRPVLSGCCAPTRPVDRLLTTYLAPLLDLLPERLQDTSDFLRKIKDFPQIPKGALIFSFDIVSLYPSIPQEEAAWVVSHFYEKNFGYVQGRLMHDFNIQAPPPYLIKEGIDHVLNGTLLRYDHGYYRQNKGTAIGASVSVAIAEIFVHASIEKERKKMQKQPLVFFRYIDDIFGIFDGKEDELKEYHEGLNKIHPDLQFTLEYDTQKLPFLDTLVYLDEEGNLQTTVFYKPSNTHQYLHFHSSHHPNLKRSLPFSQGIRIKRIVSDPRNLEKSLEEMFMFFRLRGYTHKIISEARKRLTALSREELLLEKNRKATGRIIFPMLYSPSIAPVLRTCINNIWSWLQKNAEDKPWEHWFKDPPPMIAWKKDQAIGEKLIRAEFPSPLTLKKTREMSGCREKK